MSEVSSSGPPYRFRQLRQRIDEELFDLNEMLRLAGEYQASEALTTDDREDLQRFSAGLESLIRIGEA
jgi:hypothetical protein